MCVCVKELKVVYANDDASRRRLSHLQSTPKIEMRKCEGKWRRTGKHRRKSLASPRRDYVVVQFDGERKESWMLPMRNWVKHQFAHPMNVHKFYIEPDAMSMMPWLWSEYWNGTAHSFLSAQRQTAGGKVGNSKGNLTHFAYVGCRMDLNIFIWRVSQAPTSPVEYLCFSAPYIYHAYAFCHSTDETSSQTTNTQLSAARAIDFRPPIFLSAHLSPIPAEL